MKLRLPSLLAMLSSLACFSLVGTGNALAQSAGPVKFTTVEGISEYRLNNGLKVLLMPDGSLDSITVNVV